MKQGLVQKPHRLLQLALFLRLSHLLPGRLTHGAALKHHVRVSAGGTLARRARLVPRRSGGPRRLRLGRQRRLLVAGRLERLLPAGAEGTRSSLVLVVM